jgi:bacillithiol biosynthesis deacetylase BshB1
LDILAFGAHPDDVELSCGGALAKAVIEGLKVAIIDLTAGEMGTYGTKEIRLKEGEEGKKIIGAETRENLAFKDAFLSYLSKKEDVLTIAEKIRKYQPQIVLAPFIQDRHPDHAMTGKLVTEACFLAKLQKIELDYPKHYIQQLMYFETNQTTNASFILDISDVFDVKRKAIMAHKSQFKDFTKEYLPFPVEERNRYYGALIGTEYGEAFYQKNPFSIFSWDPIINKKYKK